LLSLDQTDLLVRNIAIYRRQMKSLRTCIVILMSLSTIGQFAWGDWGQSSSNAKAIEIKLNLTQKILIFFSPGGGNGIKTKNIVILK
jgi:hypothetical protein